MTTAITTAAITHNITTLVTASHPGGRNIDIQWGYDPRSPYDITVDLGPDRWGAPLWWRLPRDLITVGRAEEVTAFDDRLGVRPIVWTELGSRYIHIRFRDDFDRTSSVLVRDVSLGKFLDAVYTLVPAGEELEHLDVSRVLAQPTRCGARCIDCGRKRVAS